MLRIVATALLSLLLLPVVAHIDRVDDVNILFGMESTVPVTSASWAASIALPAMRGI